MLDAALLGRLKTLGLHIAGDVGLMARLSRALRFVLDFHLPAAAPDAPEAGRAAAAAELAKVFVHDSTCLLVLVVTEGDSGYEHEDTAMCLLSCCKVGVHLGRWYLHLHNAFAVFQPKHNPIFTLQVEEVLSGVLLPGMMLTPAVPAVASEIYSVLAALPYTTRYRLYTQLRVRGLPEKGKYCFAFSGQNMPLCWRPQSREPKPQASSLWPCKQCRSLKVCAPSTHAASTIAHMLNIECTAGLQSFISPHVGRRQSRQCRCCRRPPSWRAWS